MSIVRCDRCERLADLDFQDMVDIAGGTGFAHFDCLTEDEIAEAESAIAKALPTQEVSND